MEITITKTVNVLDDFVNSHIFEEGATSRQIAETFLTYLGIHGLLAKPKTRKPRKPRKREVEFAAHEPHANKPKRTRRPKTSDPLAETGASGGK